MSNNTVTPTTAQEWQDKGSFWVKPAILLCLPHFVAVPAQFAVKDAGWSTAIMVVALVVLAAQIASGIRMVVCYRRARIERLAERVTGRLS